MYRWPVKIYHHIASVMLIANYGTKISVGQLDELGDRTILSYESSALVLILKAIMPLAEKQFGYTTLGHMTTIIT